jgi:organic radical activating enzyme
MKLVETSISFQGEGIYAGYPAVFVRLATCNQNCKFCDTRFSHSDQPETDVSKIVEQIKKHNPVNDLVITGGEPLLQQTEVLNLLLELKMSYSRITVETNGSIYPDRELIQLVDFFSVSPKLKGMAEYNWEPIVEQLLENLSYKMQLKFVVVTDEDYEELKTRLQVISSHRLSKVPIVLQPNGMSDTLNAYVKAYGKLALRVANDPFWKDYNVRVLMQNHRAAFKQQSGV